MPTPRARPRCCRSIKLGPEPIGIFIGSDGEYFGNLLLEDRLGGATVASGLVGKEGIDCIHEHFAVKVFVIDQASKVDHFGSELVAGFGVHKSRFRFSSLCVKCAPLSSQMLPEGLSKWPQQVSSISSIMQRR